MEEIVLYTDIISQPGRAVTIFLDICKVKYRKVEIRLFRGEHLTEEFRKISPTQTIPTLVHGDIVLYESHAIFVYIQSLLGLDNHWYPKERTAKALVDCYLHWHHLHIRVGCAMFLQTRLLFPMLYGKEFPDLEMFASATREDAFDMISGIFTQGLFVGRTTQPSVADIACYCEIITLKWSGFSLSKYPKILEWMDKIKSIPEVAKYDSALFKIIPRVKL